MTGTSGMLESSKILESSEMLEKSGMLEESESSGSPESLEMLESPEKSEMPEGQEKAGKRRLPGRGRHLLRIAAGAAVLAVLALAGCAGVASADKAGRREETEKTATGERTGKEQPAERAQADGERALDEDLIVVGVSQIGSESVWRTANTASIQRVFTKENGYFLIFKNARQKQENQIKALRSFISQRVDYIAFSPITERGWDTVLQEAKEAGIPVILVDRKVRVADDSLYTAWVGPDFVNEGRMAGEALEDCLRRHRRQDESIHIVVLQGTEGATSTIGRTRGFSSVAENHENWNILEQVDAEFTTAKGQEEMERLLRRYESIDVLISQNDDMTFGALEAIQKAGKTAGEEGDIIVISFDAVKNALKLVEEGSITADVECNADQGEYIEAVIQKLEKGETVAKLNFVPEEVFTAENVGERLKD